VESSSKFWRLALRIVGALLGLVVLVMSVQDRRALSRTQSHGKTAIAEPVGTYTERRSRTGTTYTGTFTFKTEGGQTFTVKRSFPEEVLMDFKRGAPVKVMYDPRDPSEFVWEKERGSWWGVGLGLGVLLAALFLL